MLKKLLGYTFLFSLFRASRSNDSTPIVSTINKETIPKIIPPKAPDLIAISGKYALTFFVNIELQYQCTYDCQIKEGDAKGAAKSKLILEFLSIKKAEVNKDIAAIVKQFGFASSAKYRDFICDEVDKVANMESDSLAAKILASRQASSALAK